MAIVFPASPTLNDTFIAGSITYQCVQVNPNKWIGLGVTPTDRLIEGSNSLEITAGNELIWTGGKVGVNQVTPIAILHAKSGANDGTLVSTFEGATNNKLNIRFDTFGPVLDVTAGDPLAFEIGGSEKMRLDGSGRLLVGKESHTGDALFVAESNHTSGGIIGEFDNAATDNFGGLRILGGVTDRECRFQSLYGSSFFTFYTEGTGAATERFRIKSNGDLKHTGLRIGGGENKLAILVTPSHNTSEEDVIVYQVENESLFNQITFGGGTSSYNAATTLAFNTAAVDTTGGVRALSIDSSQNILYYGATGSAGGPGGANVTKRADVNANGSLNIQIPGVAYVGHLYVMSVFNSNATVRTCRIYFISGRYGNSSVVTQLQTDNGSNGGRGFTITDISSGSSNLIQFTDTSNSSVEVSMHFVGAIGL